jgi:hypothetical protein
MPPLAAASCPLSTRAAQLASEGESPEEWTELTADEWLWALKVGLDLYVSTPHKPTYTNMNETVSTLEAMLPSMDDAQRADFQSALQKAKERLDPPQPIHRAQKRKNDDISKQQMGIQPSTITICVPDKTELRSRIQTAMNNYTNSCYRDFYNALFGIKKQVNYLCHVEDPYVNSATNIRKYDRNPYTDKTPEERTLALLSCQTEFNNMIKLMEEKNEL